MSAAQKMPSNMTSVNIDAGILIRSEPVAHVEKWTLKMLSTQVESNAFSGEEQRKATTYLKEQVADAKGIRYAFDIIAIDGSKNIEDSNRDECRSEATIRLSSKNLGYDFVLLKADGGSNLFGQPSHVVQIFRSRLGEDNYTYLQMTTSLAKALKLIDQMYCQAAELHLP